MNIIQIGVILCCCFLIYTTAQADNSYYCSQNGQYAKVGMTIAEVANACGSPKSQQTQKKPGSAKHPVKQWIYQISPTAATTGFLQFQTGNPISLIVYFKDNKVSSISIGSQSAQSSTVCSGSIAIGYSPSQVEASCGTPAIENETFENVDNGMTDEIEIWSYQSNQYAHVVTLTFLNGILQSIQQ